MRMVSKKMERKDIIKWIKELEKVGAVLQDEYDIFSDEIRKLVIDFIQTHDVEPENLGSWRKKINQKEKKKLINAVEDLKMSDLTDKGKEEANRVTIPDKLNYLDYLTLFSGLKIIKLMSFSEKTLMNTFELTIRSEFEKQAINIGLSRQYITNHIDDAIRKGVYEGQWSENIWGMYQKDLHDDVNKLIRDSVVRGQNPKVIARKLRERVEVSRYNAERLMRTEQANIQAVSQLEAYDAQGVTLYDLVVEPDGCMQCKDVEANNPHLVVGAKRSLNIQPLHPNCRCSTVARVE